MKRLEDFESNKLDVSKIYGGNAIVLTYQNTIYTDDPLLDMEDPG
ncbi:hypothetical protein ACE939_13535 [Aquimarina sp. W85]